MAQQTLNDSSPNDFSLEFDLEEIFGIDLSDDDEFKEIFAQEVIDRIVKRTKQGTLLPGSSSKGYSEEYKDSVAFRAFDKTNKVNLTLTGAMLGTMDLIEEDGNKIVIGWDDADEEAKAYNHNTGDTVPKRKFLGLLAGEIREIKSKLAPRLRGREPIGGISTRDALSLIRALRGNRGS